MKRKIKIFVALLTLTVMCITSNILVKADASSAYANKAMSIALNPGEIGDSNTISFRFNGLPERAVVESVRIDCTNAQRIGNGMGAIAPMSITITAPGNFTETVSWGSGNVTRTDRFNDLFAKGTWQIHMTGRNIAPANAKPNFVGGVKYTNVKMYIEYHIE